MRSQDFPLHACQPPCPGLSPTDVGHSQALQEPPPTRPPTEQSFGEAGWHAHSGRQGALLGHRGSCRWTLPRPCRRAGAESRSWPPPSKPGSVIPPPLHTPNLHLGVGALSGARCSSIHVPVTPSQSPLPGPQPPSLTGSIFKDPMALALGKPVGSPAPLRGHGNEAGSWGGVGGRVFERNCPGRTAQCSAR